MFILGNILLILLIISLFGLCFSEKFIATNKHSFINNVIRFCVHRRENIASYQRFMAIFEAIIKLVKKCKTLYTQKFGHIIQMQLQQ